MAAAAMQTAAGDASYPVMAGIKWRKTYEATLSTPVGVPELLLGHLGWVTIRVTFVATVFAAIMTAFGATTATEGLAAIPPAVLTGLAFAAAITAYTARLKNETGLASLFRFGIVPLFLFSGTFFPIEQLPDFMQPFAYLTPLWHGVELCRGLALGLEYTFPPLLSVGYLLLWTVAGAWLAIRILQRRLIA
jgi:lipooligosaccharide transport system permease protein